jgi:hypothetical protein
MSETLNRTFIELKVSVDMRPEPSKYLAPGIVFFNEGFSPARLTIGELIEILGFHRVDLPTQRQTKQVYVDLFKEKLAPLGPKILFDLQKTARSSSMSPQTIKRVGDSLTEQEVKRMKQTPEKLDPESRENLGSSKLPLSTRVGRKTLGDNRNLHNIIHHTKYPSSKVGVTGLNSVIDAPSNERFFISPSLPGVRTKITSEVRTVKQR